MREEEEEEEEQETAYLLGVYKYLWSYTCLSLDFVKSCVF